jgi:hypothetical protein
MRRIIVGDQTNYLNPNIRIFKGLPSPETEIVNGGEMDFTGSSINLFMLVPKEYSSMPLTDNHFYDDYRQANPYLYGKARRSLTEPSPEYANEYNMGSISLSGYLHRTMPEDADYHVQLHLLPIPPVIDLNPDPEPEPEPDPEPETPTISFSYVEGKGMYNKFQNMTTQYNNGEIITVEGEYSVDIPITFTADEGYYLNNIVIDVDGKESSFFAGSENITTKELIAENVKPDSVVTVWGYGRAIPSDVFIYSENLVNATSSMTGEVNINRGEQTITFYANEGYTFDSVGAYNVGGRSTDFYASGTEYELTINVTGDVTVDLVAVPYSNSISPFVNIYEVTKQELGELSLERFSTEYLDLHTGATSSGVDYGDMIVNLIRIPYDIPDYVVRTRQPIKLGKFETSTMSNLLNTNHVEIKLGSVKVEGENGNVTDYKNVRAFLYIPYADRMELPIQYVMDNEIEVTLELDLFSGDGVVIVTSQNVPVYKSMLTMSEKIPFVQLRDTSYSNKINALLYGATNPFISLETHEVVEQVALPTQRDVVLNSLTGYVEVDRILSIDTKASANEQTEIVGLLQRGVEIK